jgi:hypothetical protein
MPTRWAGSGCSTAACGPRRASRPTWSTPVPPSVSCPRRSSPRPAPAPAAGSSSTRAWPRVLRAVARRRPRTDPRHGGRPVLRGGGPGGRPRAGRGGLRRGTLPLSREPAPLHRPFAAGLRRRGGPSADPSGARLPQPGNWTARPATALRTRASRAPARNGLPRSRPGAPGRTRTDTGTLLRGLPLPIGLRGRAAHASGPPQSQHGVRADAPSADRVSRRGQTTVAASSVARARTASSMGSVSLPVNVFCWLTW